MAELPARSEAVIVGAGPTGLALAIMLRRLGVEPLLVDKRLEAANTSRAGVIHAGTLEALEQLQVTPRLLEEGIQVATFRMRERDRVLMKVDFSGLPSRYPFTLMCPQDRTEAILRERLEAVGGRVVRGAEILTLVQTAHGVDLSARTSRGVRTLAADWVVACDGAHSAVRDAAGISFEGGDYDRVFALADVYMTWPLSRGEVTLFLSAEGPVVVAPLPGDRFRVVATVDRSPEHPDLAFIQDLLTRRGPTEGSTIREVIWSSRFHVSHKRAAQVVKGRIVLCGDAAHVHSPAGGQGMNTGIQDAVTLAEPLVTALRDGRVADLEAWADRRRRVARGVISLTDRMTRAASLRSGAAQAARNSLLAVAGQVPAVPRMIARRLAQLDRP